MKLALKGGGKKKENLPGSQTAHLKLWHGAKTKHDINEQKHSKQQGLPKG